MACRALALAVMVALFLRALVPTGYMLSPSMDGDVLAGITICSAQGSRLADDGLAGATSKDQAPAHHGHELCGFAVSAVTDVPPLAALEIAPWLAFVAAPTPVLRDLVAVAAPIGPQLGSRAPPVRA